jgi:hypothetical protein
MRQFGELWVLIPGGEGQPITDELYHKLLEVHITVALQL